MAGRRHLVAFNRSVRAHGLADADLAADVVELGRDLARKLDRSVGPDLSVRLIADYRAVINELERRSRDLVARGAENGVETPRGTPQPTGQLSSLAELRLRKRRLV